MTFAFLSDLRAPVDFLQVLNSVSLLCLFEVIESTALL